MRNETFSSFTAWLTAGCALMLSASLAAAPAGRSVEYIQDEQGAVSGYLALPSGKGTHPGIILIHEWWGLNEDIRQKAREYAEAGYAALAVDLYEGRVTTRPEVAQELATKVRGDTQAAFAHLRAALEWLGSHPRVNGQRLASVGWCFGGGWSYEIARNQLGTKASIIYYGQFNPKDDLSKMRATILGHFAEQDLYIRVDDVRQFQAKLSTLNGEHEVFIYPNTQHSFDSSNRPAYDAKASDRAWQRSLAFLRKHL